MRSKDVIRISWKKNPVCYWSNINHFFNHFRIFFSIFSTYRNNLNIDRWGIVTMSKIRTMKAFYLTFQKLKIDSSRMISKFCSTFYKAKVVIDIRSVETLGNAHSRLFGKIQGMLNVIQSWIANWPLAQIRRSWGKFIA